MGYGFGVLDLTSMGIDMGHRLRVLSGSLIGGSLLVVVFLFPFSIIGDDEVVGL